MSAVWMRLRSEIRTRWRSWLGLALLIGLAGAAASAAAAGARRTETAYPRFVQAQNGYDLVTGGSAGNIDPARALAQMEAMPEVAQWARVDVAASTAILPSGREAPNPFVAAAERPANVVSLASIAGLPVALSGLLALIAAGTLAHTLVSSTRSRRRDLAILKTLGFIRRQIRRAVSWQATTIAVIALGIGLPAGIAGGRWAWHVFAAQLGVLPEPAIPLTTILIAIPAALALANLIAAAPGQAAARTQPATILRTE